jgi:hypothetical protein
MANVQSRQAIDPLEKGGTTRVPAVLGLVGALLQVCGGILESVHLVLPGEPGFGLRTAIMGVAYLFLLVLVAGLWRSPGVSGGTAARLGLASAIAGWALSAVAQFLLPVRFDLAEQVLFPVATILIGVGMTLFGVSVYRGHRWAGWRRAIPLVCGLYPFLVIFPAFAAAGGPNFLVLSGWGACWVALAAAAAMEASNTRTTRP